MLRAIALTIWLPAAAAAAGNPSGTCDATLFLAGDTIITRPWSDIEDPDFVKVVDEMRAADVAIVNLETVIHDYQGYAQADAGGTYMRSPPAIAAELAWAGIDMVAHANNHTFDYGSIGVLENLGYAQEAGLVVAGSGQDLQNARAPRFIDNGRITVGLVSTASTFIPYGLASRTRPDMRGRPGLNPLRIFNDRVFVIPAWAARAMERVAKLAGFGGKRFRQQAFRLGGYSVRVGDGFGTIGKRIQSKDLAENLDAVSTAATQADIVIASIHAHQQGPMLQEFAYQAIDSGADVFFAHGPHEILGVEIYKNKPIFYSMGDFVYQFDQVERFPAEYYDRFGLGDDATAATIFSGDYRPMMWPGTADRPAYESFVSSLCIRNGEITTIRMLPMDLQYDEELPLRGSPRYASQKLGEAIINEAARESEAYGTVIQYDAERNVGLIRLD